MQIKYFPISNNDQLRRYKQMSRESLRTNDECSISIILFIFKKKKQQQHAIEISSNIFLFKSMIDDK
jgi:hypothetical protein